MNNANEVEKKEGVEEFGIPYYQIPYDKFFQFGVSVDCVVFGYHEEKLKVLVIKRGVEPFKGTMALPGDLVYPNENIDVAAQRVLFDLTGIKGLFMEQTQVYGKVDRHPGGRVITTGYYSLIDISKHDPHAAAWADGVYWMDVASIHELAFDHLDVLRDAIEILRERVRRRPVGFELLPRKFTLAQLQQLYEVLLNENYDKANFRKKILAMNLLNDLKENQKNVSHRPAKLFSFDMARYVELKSKGISFEL